MSKIPADKALYLIHGDDDFLVQESARALVHALCPPAMESTGLVTIDGAVDRADEIETVVRETIQGLFTVSLFGDRTVVWLKDASFLNPRKDPGRGAEAKAQVQGLLDKLKAGAPGNVLVVSGAPLDKRSALYKFLAKEGHVAAHMRPEKTWKVDESAEQVAADRFAAAGLEIARPLLQRFIQRTGPETRQIHHEIEKLSLFAGEGGTVTQDMVDDLVTPAREAILWDFTDAMGMADLERSLAQLRRLLAQRENPVALVIQVVNRFRELLLLRECMDRGWLRNGQWDQGPEATEHLDRLQPDPRKIHPFRTKNLARQAGNYTRSTLARARDYLVRTHEQMVSSRMPQELLLELAVIRIAGRHRKQ